MWPKVTSSSQFINTTRQNWDVKAWVCIAWEMSFCIHKRQYPHFARPFKNWQLLHFFNRKKRSVIRSKNNPHLMCYKVHKTCLTLPEAHKGNLFLCGNKRKTVSPTRRALQPWLSVLVMLIELPQICSGVSYFGCCSAGCCSSFLLSLFLWLCSAIPIPWHIRLHPSCFLHTVYCRVSDSKSPQYTLPQGRQQRSPFYLYPCGELSDSIVTL